MLPGGNFQSDNMNFAFSDTLICFPSLTSKDKYPNMTYYVSL